jgi:tetratricopeptide (TPR) repeat protein
MASTFSSSLSQRSHPPTPLSISITSARSTPPRNLTPRTLTPRSLTPRKKELIKTFLAENNLNDDCELILKNIEPLLNSIHDMGNSYFPMELLWLLCRPSFGDSDQQTPEFLTAIDLLESNHILVSHSDNEYFEFKSISIFHEVATDQSQWDDYYLYWATKLSHLNQRVYSKDLADVLNKFNLFQNHYQKLISYLSQTQNSSTERTDTIRELGRILGGNVGRICGIVLQSTSAFEFTRSLLHICQPPSLDEMRKDRHVASYLFDIGHPASKVPQPTAAYVGAILEYAHYLRLLQCTLPKVLDYLYDAAFQSTLLLRSDESWRLHLESLLQIAMTQHEQFDRPTGQETKTVTTALSENVEYLYLEVITKCENAPRGIQPEPECVILLSRAQASLALLYASLERYEESALLFSKSLANKRLILPETHPFIAETYYFQAYLHRDQGSYELARECYDMALNTFIVSYPETSFWIARCYVGLGLVDDDQGDDETALVNYAKGIDIYRNQIQPHFLPAADVYMNIGALLLSKDRLSDAEEAYQLALSIYQHYFNSIPSHPDILAAEKAYAELHPSEPEDHSESVNTKKDKVNLSINLGFQSPREDSCVLANNYFQRGVHTSFPESVGFLTIQGLLMENHEFYADAELAYRDALEICRQVERIEIDEEHVRKEKAKEVRRMKRLRRLEEEKRHEMSHSTKEEGSQSTAAQDRTNSEPSDDGQEEVEENENQYVVTTASHYIAFLLYRLAGILEEVHRSDQSSNGQGTTKSGVSPLSSTGEVVTLKLILSLYEEALNISRFVLGEESLLVADTLVKLGQLHCYEDEIVDLTMSDHLLDESLTIYSLIWRSDSHRDIFETKYLLARTLSLQGNYSEANEICQEIIDGYQFMHSHLSQNAIPSSPSLSLFQSSSLTPETSQSLEERLVVHTDLANSLNNYANLLQEQSNYSQAEKFYRLSLNLYLSIYSADLLAANSRHRSSSRYDQSAGDLSFVDDKVSLVAHPLVARAYNNLGSLYDDMNDHNSAKEMYEKALSILSEIHGTEGHPQIAIVAINLASLLTSEGLNDDAKSLYEIALAIYRDKYGENHSSVQETLLLLEKAESKPSLCAIQ